MSKYRALKRKPYRIKIKNSFVKSRYFWFPIIFLVIISTTFYFFVFWGEIQVLEVKISGNKNVESQNIKNAISDKINRKILSLSIPSFFKTGGKWIVSSKSIFLVDKNAVKEEILNDFPEIDNVKIEKKFPNSLVLEIKERTPAAVFCQNEKCFLIDDKGIIFKTEIGDLGGRLVIQLLGSQNDFSLGQEAVGKDIIDLIHKIEKNLNDNFQVEVKRAEISLPERLNIETSENWKIYFNLKSDMDLQITKLNFLLKTEVLPEIRKNLEYIDLRFNRAYYK